MLREKRLDLLKRTEPFIFSLLSVLLHSLLRLLTFLLGLISSIPVRGRGELF